MRPERPCPEPRCNGVIARGSRRERCEPCGNERRRLAQRQYSKDNRARMRVGTVKPVRAEGRNTRTRGVHLSGRAVVEIKSALFEISAAHIAARQRIVDDPTLRNADLDAYLAAVTETLLLLDGLLPKAQRRPKPLRRAG